MKLKIHPLCDKLPSMPDEEFKELVEDIRINGQRDPIWAYNNVLLDGKHRLQACELLGLEPEIRKWTPKHGPEEPQIKAFVLSKNFYRRQLNASQRAIIVAEMVTTLEGGVRINAHPKSGEKPDETTVSQSDAANAASVSRRTVQQATDVLESGSAALVEAVKAGEVSVADAAKIVDLPKVEQTAAVNAVLSGDAATVTQAAREAGDDEVEPEHDEKIKDGRKGPLPRKLRPVFFQCKTFNRIINELGKIRGEIEELQRSDAGAAIPINEILKDLPAVQKAIKFAVPYTECPKCQRKIDKDCKTCEGLGWITEATWNRCKTKEFEQWLSSRS